MAETISGKCYFVEPATQRRYLSGTGTFTIVRMGGKVVLEPAQSGRPGTLVAGYRASVFEADDGRSWTVESSETGKLLIVDGPTV